MGSGRKSPSIPPGRVGVVCYGMDTVWFLRCETSGAPKKGRQLSRVGLGRAHDLLLVEGLWLRKTSLTSPNSRPGNENFAGVRDVHLAVFALNPEAAKLPILLFAALGCVSQEELIFEHHVQLLQERREGNGSLKTLVERLSARAVGKLGQVALPQVDAIEIAAEAA